MMSNQEYYTNTNSITGSSRQQSTVHVISPAGSSDDMTTRIIGNFVNETNTSLSERLSVSVLNLPTLDCLKSDKKITSNVQAVESSDHAYQKGIKCIENYNSTTTVSGGRYVSTSYPTKKRASAVSAESLNQDDVQEKTAGQAFAEVDDLDGSYVSKKRTTTVFDDDYHTTTAGNKFFICENLVHHQNKRRRRVLRSTSSEKKAPPPIVFRYNTTPSRRHHRRHTTRRADGPAGFGRHKGLTSSKVVPKPLPQGPNCKSPQELTSTLTKILTNLFIGVRQEQNGLLRF